MENIEIQKKLDEQNGLYEMEQQEHDRLLQERFDSYSLLNKNSSCFFSIK